MKEKFEKLMEHIGYEQISDIQQVDIELGERPSTGTRLATLLIENAQNQTGIRFTSKDEEKVFTNWVKNKFC